jgi:2-oxoglutarate ferredoxin oxidoreductase subunit beta
LKEAMKKALSKEGFSFVEAVTQCPSIFGRRVGMEDGRKMLQWFKDSSVPISKAREMTGEQLVGRITVGEFTNIEKAGLLRKMKEAATRVSSVA